VATKQIMVERFSVVSAKPFTEVVRAIEAEVGHPDIKQFYDAIREAADDQEGIVSLSSKRVGFSWRSWRSLGRTFARESGVRATMIGVKPDGQRLADIGKMIDDGKLRPLVQEVLPLEHAKEALELSRSRHVGGKIVLSDRSRIGTVSKLVEMQK
jgi:NADPH:quinone reductase-like Zn-dependent oxidoreductase